MTEGRADLSNWREPQALIETGALDKSLGTPELRIVDCTTWLKPAEPGDDAPYRVVPGRAEYDAEHIPGAVFLDIQGTISEPGHAPAVHGADRRAVRGRHGRARHRRRIPRRALLGRQHHVGDPGLVDVARLRIRPCGGARWRLGEVEGGGAPRILRTGRSTRRRASPRSPCRAASWTASTCVPDSAMPAPPW